MTRLPSAPRLAVALGALLLTGAALAQYKVVGPDGRVTYTDKPPATQAPGTRVGGDAGGGATANAAPPSTSGVPYETRQAMQRFPVALYASRSCGPCDQARTWLKTQGIPFTEYGINADADVRALAAKFGDTSLPMVTVGGQTLRGYNAPELETTIHAAGYPSQVKLFGYQWPAAVPLAPPTTTAAAPAAPNGNAAPAPSAPRRPAPPPPTTAPSPIKGF